ncbi:hypothetical protein [Schaalia cardiffensis]|uniref:hypothetical protein n=1 Tax=Schaalia cardiffensis TaxID=181487 RepID=UPI0023F27E00|nr:hypothetical protein [Schaalia cardiffensis]
MARNTNRPPAPIRYADTTAEAETLAQQVTADIQAICDSDELNRGKAINRYLEHLMNTTAIVKLATASGVNFTVYLTDGQTIFGSLLIDPIDPGHATAKARVRGARIA